MRLPVSISASQVARDTPAERVGLALRTVVAVVRDEPVAILILNQVPQFVQQDQRPRLAAARGKPIRQRRIVI